MDNHTLPEELVDTILGQLDSATWMGKRSLASCSLVCKLWLNLTRRHLFRSITVVVSYFQQNLQQRRPRSPEELLEFICGAAEISGCIRELTLQVDLEHWAEDRQLEHSEGCFPPHTLYRILLSLPRLHALRLCDIIMPSFFELPDQKLQINKLIIRMPHSVDEDGMLDVLGLFSRVDVLVLADIEYDTQMSDDPRPLNLPVSIQPHTLRMQEVSSIALFLKVFQDSHALSNVHSLRLRRVEDHDDAEAVSRVIADTSKSLVHLDLDVGWAISVFKLDVPPALQLQFAANLQSLVLGGLFANEQCYGVHGCFTCVPIWKHLADLLATCQSIPIRDLFLEFDPRVTINLVLANMRFAAGPMEESIVNLRELRAVTFVHKRIRDTDKETVAMLLPRLHTRGVIRFLESLDI